VFFSLESGKKTKEHKSAKKRKRVFRVRFHLMFSRLLREFELK
jgi:hypothetical protein